MFGRRTYRYGCGGKHAPQETRTGLCMGGKRSRDPLPLTHTFTAIILRAGGVSDFCYLGFDIGDGMVIDLDSFGP